MAASGYTPILLYASGTATNVPLAANLTSTATGAELAINYTDGKLFYKDNTGTVQVIASKATGSVAGANTQLIYNNSGAYAGSANMTFNGTSLTLANDASISGLTVGKGGGSQASNTVLGSNALGANTTGYGNAGFGFYSLNLNTTGTGNSGFGSGTLQATTTGGSNTAVGYSALNANTTASNNTAVGYQAGYSGTTANSNTFVGTTSGYSCTTGSANTFIGNNAGYSVTTGYRNTFVGNSNQVSGASGGLITTGYNNTIIGNYTGNQGGLDIRTASNYIVLSDGDGNPNLYYDGSSWNFTPVANNVSIKTTITASGGVGLQSYYTQATGTPFYAYFYYNGANVGNINGTSASTVYATSSDQRLKENIIDAPSALSKIDSIKIRSFDWAHTKEAVEFGVIAQELYEVAPEAVAVGLDHEDGTIDKPWGVDISFLVPALIKAVQEQQAIIESLTTRIAALEAK